jgi:DNA-cytosine methyltransferase
MSVACRGLPLKPVFFSEIEPFPCAVLKAHYPDVPNLGDMSKIQVSENGKEVTNGTTRIILAKHIDILAGGTPCQDVSVAGKRAGMSEGSGTRSSLAFEFVRLARELRPRWVLWENVAGSIASKNAPDFLRFLSALGDCGYSLAWRVLDAQYVRVDGMERAVPQRRRRVWVVGYSGADESIPAQILFESDCVAGHTPRRRRTGQGFAYSLTGRDRVDAGVVGEPRVCSCSAKQQSLAADEQLAASLGSSDYKEPQCIALDQGAGKSSVNTTVEHSPTLATTHQGEPCIALDGDKLKPRTDQRKGGNGFGINEEGAGYTLTAVDRHGVAYKSECFENHAQDSRIKPIEVSDTRNQKDGTGGNNLPLVVHKSQIPFVKTSHAKGKGGLGEKWERCEVAGVRNAIEGNDGRNQECIVSTNSNGGDVAATINANMSKLGGDNQTTFGGGYVVSRRGVGA